MRWPTVRVALVLVLGTCLWAMVGRRERVVEAVAASPAVDVSEQPATATASRPPVSIGVRRLPQRMLSRPVELPLMTVHADFESESAVESSEIHAAGFTVEVSANAPAWLTGEIEVE